MKNEKCYFERRKCGKRNASRFTRDELRHGGQNCFPASRNEAVENFLRYSIARRRRRTLENEIAEKGKGDRLENSRPWYASRPFQNSRIKRAVEFVRGSGSSESKKHVERGTQSTWT